MSGNFWAQRLTGQQAPAAAPTPAPAPPSNRPWWLPAAPPVQPQYPVQAASQPEARSVLDGLAGGSVTPTEEAHFGDLLRQDGYTTEKAQSAKDGESCPDCSSPNYMRSPTSKNSMKQCFNCGYNERFAHSTAGATGIGQQNVAPPKAARVQTNTAPAGFPAMGTVVGHIG